MRGGARLVMSALLRVVRVAVRELTHRRVAHDIADVNARADLLKPFLFLCRTLIIEPQYGFTYVYSSPT